MAFEHLYFFLLPPYCFFLMIFSFWPRFHTVSSFFIWGFYFLVIQQHLLNLDLEEKVNNKDCKHQFWVHFSAFKDEIISVADSVFTVWDLRCFLWPPHARLVSAKCRLGSNLLLYLHAERFRLQTLVGFGWSGTVQDSHEVKHYQKSCCCCCCCF